MSEHQSTGQQGLAASEDQPLIGIPVTEDHQELVRYFTDEQAADDATSEQGILRALSLAGAWKDLGEWSEVERDLEEIRHASLPTPPIDEL